MAFKERKPPGGPAEQLSWNFVATNYTPRDNPQAKKKQPSFNRPTGPGEVARTRELRRRKIHLTLIETWRP